MHERGIAMNTPTQPVEMKTKAYVYGVDTLDGDDAWALFEAAAIRSNLRA
jgi:hypothetical protein